MGCNNSKADENTQERSFTFCWRKRNKVVPINVPVREKAGPSLNAECSNTARKTEQTALMQLKNEGIVPKKGEGGVAFILEIGGTSESDDSTPFTFPGVPEYKRQYPQYAPRRRAEPESTALRDDFLQLTKHPLTKSRSEQDSTARGRQRKGKPSGPKVMPESSQPCRRRLMPRNYNP